MDYLHPLPHVVGPFPRRWPSRLFARTCPRPGKLPLSLFDLLWPSFFMHNTLGELLALFTTVNQPS